MSGVTNALDDRHRLPFAADDRASATDPILAARIYVVDDEPSNLALIERVLRRAGFTQTRTYLDSAAALAAIEVDEPDILLLDLHMGGLDGFGVLAALSKMLPLDSFLPVVIMTGDVERDVRTRALTSGATDFVTKPFDTEEVVLRTRNLLRTRQLHQQLQARNAGLVNEARTAATALTETEAQWRAVAEGLTRLTTAETAEATAAAVCAELATLPDLAGVGLFAFTTGQVTLPLALDLEIEAGLAVNVPLPAELSAMLRRTAPSGAWIVSADDAGATSSAQRWLAQAGLAAAAFAPLHSQTALVGLLAAGATGRDAATRLGAHMPALEAFASVAAALLAPGIEDRQRTDQVRTRIQCSIDDGAFVPVFQPIVDLRTGAITGYEALTRFADGVRPDRRFTDAAAIGLGLELEVATLKAALASARRLPRGAYISLNVSPDLIIEGQLLANLLKRIARPIVLEVTEHAQVDDYPALRAAIDRLGSSVRFAVDDAGAGYSSFRHIMELRPDFVKLDIGLVRAIADDPIRRAFVAGMVLFAHQAGCTLIAEGVESAAERDVLQGLAVGLGQGYLFGRPEPVTPEVSAERSVRPSPLVRIPQSVANANPRQHRATVVT